MNDRDRLIELEKRAITDWENGDVSERIADHLLANGVTFQKWISVEDELPEKEKVVLVYCKTQSGKYGDTYCAFHVPTGVLREESDYDWDDECCEKYNEEADDYEVSPGWYKVIHNWDVCGALDIGNMVTHWMPLPEAPKEG